jgi:biotin carboxyl carrier protein
MKLRAQLDNQSHELEFVTSADRMLVRVDDREYEIEVREPEPDCYLLLSGNNVYDCRVSTTGISRQVLQIDLNGETYSVSIVDPKRLRGSENSDTHHHGKSEIVAPMPGKIVKVSVEPGAQVEKGDGIVVVEAMKMQNEMKAPRAGVVAAIHVAPGATVNGGDVLAVIED